MMNVTAERKAKSLISTKADTLKKKKKKNSSITTINLDNEVSLVKQVNALTIHLAIK